MLDGEITLAKAEVHLHGDKSGKGIIRKIREAFDPEAAEMVYAAADMQRMKSLTALAEEIMKLGVPSNVAYVWAYDTKRGVDRLTNFSGVLDKASEHIEDGKSYSEPSREFVSNFTPVAEKASEDYAREILGKLLAGEMESPGSFSKRTLSILGDMGKSDADAFAKLCSRCAGDDSTGPIPMLIGRNDPFELSVDETNALDGLGLTNSIGSFFSSAHNIPLSSGLIVPVGDKRFLLKKEDGLLTISNRVFTKYGLELSTLFPLGGEVGFSNELVDRWKRDGIVVKLIVEVLDGGVMRTMQM